MKRPASEIPVKAAHVPGEGKLKIAAGLLWFVAVLQVLAGAAFMAHAREEVDDYIQRILHLKRVTLYQVDAVPADQRAEFDQHRDSLILRFRLWHACEIGIGLMTAACALKLRRKPIALVLFPLSMFGLVTGAKVYQMESIWLAEVFGRIALVNVFLAAVVCVLAARKEQKNAAEESSLRS